MSIRPGFGTAVYPTGRSRSLTRQNPLDHYKARQQQEVTKAREQILTIAQTLGVSVEELLVTGGAKAKGSGKKIEAQYQNPADSAQRWTGRGRQPKWIAEGLAGGKSLDDFRI
jgi:DNA-binding protein H-NS